jgi:Uma2 family endonuclease
MRSADVFVYPHAIDQQRMSLSVRVDGPPMLIIEVLSESTYDVDLDLVLGKGYSYAHAGVYEYLALDPTGAFVPEGGRAWRLQEGAYRPWEPDENGRWQSHPDPAGDWAGGDAGDCLHARRAAHAPRGRDRGRTGTDARRSGALE